MKKNNYFGLKLKKSRLLRKTRRFFQIAISLYVMVFSSVGPAFAQIATPSAIASSSAQIATDSAALNMPIPHLRLPFDGIYPISLGFGAVYSDKTIIDKLGDIAKDGHDGIDFALPEGTPVYAVDDGNVVLAGESDFGLTVKIDHAWGSSVYGHLKEIKVKVGDHITASENTIIGLSGSTGISDGPHLHFGVKPKQTNGVKDIFGFIDPSAYMDLSQLPIETQFAGSPSDQLLATGSAIATSATASAVLGATTQATESASQIPQSLQADNVATDSAYLFDYKFDLARGTTAHFYDKETKRPSFAIADQNYQYKLRFFLQEDTQNASGSASSLQSGSGQLAPVVKNNTIEFPVIVSGIPMILRYTVNQNEVKEEFVIPQKPSDAVLANLKDTLQVPFSVSADGLKMQQKNGEYIFVSQNGDLVWRILAPTVKDAANKEGTTDDISLAMTDSQAILGVKTDFLKSASYPVVIDPTWTQSDWSGGSGTSTSNQYSSLSNTTGSVANQVTLSPTEQLSNTGFESDLSGWTASNQSLSDFWTMDEASGTRADSVGSATLSLQGSVTQTTGKISNAVHLTASSSQSLFTSSGTPLVGTTSDWTVAAWVWLDSKPSTSETIIGQWASSRGKNFKIRYAGTSGGDRFTATIPNANDDGDGVTVTANNFGSPSISTWYFIVVRNNTTANTIGISVNGGTENTASRGTVGTNLSNPNTYIGETENVGAEYWDGRIDAVGIWKKAISNTEISQLYNSGNGLQSPFYTNTRDTTTTYNSSAGSSKIVATANTNFSQSVNVGNTNTYYLSAYAYTDGSTVSSSDVQLLYNGSPITTTYTAAAGNWWQLTGTLTGANASRSYGVQVLAGKTVYVDNFSLKSMSGTLTSAIFDAGDTMDWNALSYSLTTPSNTSGTVWVRTGNNSSLSDASSFSSSCVVSNNATIGGSTCAPNGKRYAQYQLNLSNTDGTSTPTFTSVSLSYGLNAPSSFAGTAASSSSITWSWADNSSGETGYKVEDTNGNVVCTTGASATSCTETGLSANTSYTRNVFAYNSQTTSSVSSNASALTLSIAPTTSTITASIGTKTWTNSGITFTNSSGFGSGGVQYFLYAFDTVSTHTFSGSESRWTSSTLTQTPTSDSNSWYLHLKSYNSGDVANGTLDFGPFYYDATAPNAVTLSSPATNSYLASSRPTFTWQAATTGDNLSGLAKYKFTIQNDTNGNYITIDNIPITGTQDYVTSQYRIHFQGFTDGDPTNNYISLYTTSSSSWPSTANDGNLYEGKNTWTVIAVDNAGNTASSGQTIYADFTSPSLSNVSIPSVGEKDTYSLVTSQAPQITGVAADNLALNYLLVSFYQQNSFLGISTGESLALSDKQILSSTSDNFVYTPSKNLDYGKYRVVVAVFDQAGNSSSSQTFSLQLLTVEKAQELLQNTNTKPSLITGGESLHQLEKKALLRRQKEAAQLALFLASLKKDAINLAKAVGLESFLNTLIAQAGNLFQKQSTLAKGIFNNAGQAIDIQGRVLTKNIGVFFTTSDKNLITSQNHVQESIQNKIAISTENISKTKVPLFAGTDKALRNSLEAISVKTEGIQKSLGQTTTRMQVAVTDFIQTSMQKTQLSLTNTNTTIKNQISLTQSQTSNTIAQTTDSVQKNIANSLAAAQKITQNQIAKANSNTTKRLQEVGQGIQVAFRSITKPAVDVKNTADRVSKGFAIAVDTFQAYVFDQNPTKISEVALLEKGKDYVVISWKTNHYTHSNKVNYGENLSYGHEAWAQDGEKDHTVKITGLKPNTKYFFEVMGQDKNYVYDAFYSFDTDK